MNKKLAQLIDESAFSQGDWQAAYESLHEWLANNKKNASEEDCLAYLSCCAESVKTPNVTTLTHQLKFMLKSFGFEKAKDI